MSEGNSSKGKLEDVEILYGFLGWLTARAEAVTFSRHHNAIEVMSLMERFCAANGLSMDCRDRYTDFLKHPPVLEGEVGYGD